MDWDLVLVLSSMCGRDLLQFCAVAFHTLGSTQKCGLGFSTSTSTKFDVWERFDLVLRRCLSYSGFASLEKSLNFRGNPWIPFFFSKRVSLFMLLHCGRHRLAKGLRTGIRTVAEVNA